MRGDVGVRYRTILRVIELVPIAIHRAVSPLSFHFLIIKQGTGKLGSEIGTGLGFFIHCHF